MKLIPMCSALLLTLASPEAGAQQFTPVASTPFPAAERIRKADARIIERNYAAALEEQNEGIVESALAHVAFVRICRPHCPLVGLRRKVDSLVMHGSTPTVRYKAFLTSLVFSSPDLVADSAYWQGISLEELFPALSQRMRSGVLTAAEVR